MINPTSLTNMYLRDENKTFKYNMPVLHSDNPIVQCALDMSASFILQAYQYSLNDDGYVALARIVDSGNYDAYLEILTESAMANTFANLEDIIFDDTGYVESNNFNVPGDEILSYLNSNIHHHQQTMKNFAFLILVNVISNLVKIVSTLETDGVKVDTYVIMPVAGDRMSLTVTCYIDKTIWLPIST